MAIIVILSLLAFVEAVEPAVADGVVVEEPELHPISKANAEMPQEIVDNFMSTPMITHVYVKYIRVRRQGIKRFAVGSAGL
ncbi:MAG TPA: hypothetical protein VK934_12210 [Fimbriimonas sp.]|nr:hypothetical protein [Fimbriimonas sp.]